MLYKLNLAPDSVGRLEPVPFSDLSAVGKLEKDLENILAEHLLDVLFEDAPLMPIFQERRRQSEADLYALNEDGDLFIFELKRSGVGEEAVSQLLRYAQVAGQWTFKDLEKKYASYRGASEPQEETLATIHQEAFQLEDALRPDAFNRYQHLWLIGSAADDKLIDTVEYWRRQGLSIRFAPYRLYNVGDEHYFEFFSAPHDRHSNPADTKGVLFDTNRSYNEDSIWDMMEKKRISAYGDRKDAVEYLGRGDIVFYSHRGYGLVAAAKVKSGVKIDQPEEKYRDVEFLTSIPNRRDGVNSWMSFSQVIEITGSNFFWARIDKRPHLSNSKARTLLGELRNVIL